MFDFSLPLWGFESRWTPLRKLQSVAKIIAGFSNWHTVLLDHIGLARGNYVYRRRSGIELEVRGGTADRHIVFEIFEKRVYPIDLRPGSTVIDVGAHAGYFTLLAARQGAQVYCFEPVPANLERLQRNLQRNALRSVRVFPLAVWSHPGRRRLFLPDDHRRNSEYSLVEGPGRESIEVDCTTLDEIVRENRLASVDLLKIDCEGGEYQILYGTSRKTLDCVRALIVECGPVDGQEGASAFGVQAYLDAAGFRTKHAEGIVYAERVD